MKKIASGNCHPSLENDLDTEADIDEVMDND